VSRVDITINPSDLQWIYNNLESDETRLASIHFKNKWIDESVDSVGFRLRGNTSRYSQKKSFKISFNDFIPGREFYGIDKLNLNGEHNDPSIARTKLCMDLFQNIGMKASRAAHTEVYINDEYYGLYISVEQVDDEFLRKNYGDDSGNLWKCLYPADLIYISKNPDSYKMSAGTRPVYELTTNETVNDFGKLSSFIDIINNTPIRLLPDSIEKTADVPEILKFLAVDVLVGQWDGYWSNRNNFYLYHEPSEDKMHIIPYDYDNTFGIDWFDIDWWEANPYNFPKINSGDRPLAENLLAVAQYRNLYTHFLEFYREKVFNLLSLSHRIDSIKNMISRFVLNDTYRTKDWGFTINDFYASYSIAPYSNQHVKKGLKEFINLRDLSLEGELNYISADPIVYKIDWFPKNPSAHDSIYVTVSAFSNFGLSSIDIQFTPEGSAAGNYSMSFSPVLNSKKVEDADRWTGVIPPLGINTSGSFKIFIKDADQRSMLYPRDKSISVKSPAILNGGLVINEFMADNDHIVTDSAGDYQDWIEIYNPTSEDILLSGLYLTDKPGNPTKWRFPGDSLKIQAGEYLLIWCDEEQEEGNFHTNFALSADGEFIGLTYTDGLTIIDSITFGPQKTDTSSGRYPDAGAEWRLFSNPTPGNSNLITSVFNKDHLPSDFELNAYPNPFNPETIIRYSIPASETDQINVTLKIFDVLGNEVAVLADKKLAAGVYEVKFNARDLSSGIYFYLLQADDYKIAKKLVLLK
ncbi:MAG: CotH kinase family protein, partial [Ignavibacteria bacterium]